ncbi:MAG TPA: methyltransferase domain-containing protein [Terriglobia bacterium]|nr:methyltransferase domain-containing protein [Terriglobia bacterium]
MSMAEAMVEGLDLANAGAVVEYGPGTGVFTGKILERVSPSTRFLAIEISPRLAAIFREQYPDVPLAEDSVANVGRLCAEAGIVSVDVIVSGLPWAAFPDSLQRELLDATMSVLRPGGTFVTFAYLHGLPLPAGRRFRKLLGEYFSSVRRSDIVWPNLPPALVYRCIR